MKTIDITAPEGYEVVEVSVAKTEVADWLGQNYLDNPDMIHAAEKIVSRLIEMGWRPTEDQPAVDTVSVVCLVCMERLEYKPVSSDGTLWGMIPLWDVACAEVTMVDPTGEVAKHVDAHRADGTHQEALRKQMVFERERANHMLDAEGQWLKR